MERGPRQTFEPAGAGGILIGVTAAVIAVGALIGWAAGSVGLGCLGGSVVGIPAGIFAVYRRYRRGGFGAAAVGLPPLGGFRSPGAPPWAPRQEGPISTTHALELPRLHS